MGYTVNVPLEEGLGDKRLLRIAFERILIPVADNINPELVLVGRF